MTTQTTGPSPTPRRSTARALTLALALAAATAPAACVVQRAPEREGDNPELGSLPAGPRPRAPHAAGGHTAPLPPELEARRLAAIDKLRQGDVAGGRAALAALAAETPAYALYNDLAVAAGVAGDWDAVLAACDKALALDPDGVDAGANRIQAMLELGDRSGALDRAAALVERHPDDVGARVALAATYLALIRLPDARREYEAALDRDPDDVAAATGLFAIAAYDASAPEARELGERLLARLPDDPYVLHLMGVTEERRKEPKAAKAYYQRAIAAAERLPPDRRGPLPWSHYNLGQLLETEAGLDAARPHYQAFLELAPPSAVIEREGLEKKLGR